MSAFAGRVRRRLLIPGPQEVTFGRRGFHVGEPAARDRLENVGRSFLTGLRAGLEAASPEAPVPALAGVSTPLRGFAFEGAAMGLAIGDAMTLRPRHHLATFAAGPGAEHIYMVQVGAGWAMARLPSRLHRRVALPDPLLRWLACDGLGFHQAYFDPQRYVRDGDRPGFRPPWPDPAGYAARAVDQGIGRALWFRAGADVEHLVKLIEAFAADRRGDLWSGVGLAATYAGGASRERLTALAKLAGPHRPQLAQGAAFAAEARLRAGLVTPEAVEAVDVVCETGLAAAALVTRDTRTDLPAVDAPVPRYEVWRRRIQHEFRHLRG